MNFRQPSALGPVKVAAGSVIASVIYLAPAVSITVDVINATINRQDSLIFEPVHSMFNVLAAILV
jgi:hypothetical protein